MSTLDYFCAAVFVAALAYVSFVPLDVVCPLN